MASPPFDQLSRAPLPPCVVLLEPLAEHAASAARVRVLCQAMAHNFEHGHYVDPQWLHEVARRLGFDSFAIQEPGALKSDRDFLAGMNDGQRPVR